MWKTYVLLGYAQDDKYKIL